MESRFHSRFHNFNIFAWNIFLYFWEICWLSVVECWIRSGYLLLLIIRIQPYRFLLSWLIYFSCNAFIEKWKERNRESEQTPQKDFSYFEHWVRRYKSTNWYYCSEITKCLQGTTWFLNFVKWILVFHEHYQAVEQSFTKCLLLKYYQVIEQSMWKIP